MHVLLIKEKACAAFHHRLQRPSPAVRDDGPARSHGLHRHEAEILITGKNESPAPGVMVPQHLGRLTPEELDVAGGHGAQARHLVPLADDDQALSQAREGLHGDIRPLVADELPDHEVEIVPPVRQTEHIHVHGGIDDIRRAAVVLGDAPGDIGGIGHEVVDPVGAQPVPEAQIVEHRGHQHALDPPESGRVLVAHVPDIAHGGMAIADMQRAGTGEHALGGSRFAGNDEVVAPQVELFQSQRHEGQIFLVPAPGKGQGTDEGGRDRTAR